MDFREEGPDVADILGGSCNLRPFEAVFFLNIQKSFGDKSREYGGCSIPVIDFWARNFLTEKTLCAGALTFWRI
jgi:hypothetical protein